MTTWTAHFVTHLPAAADRGFVYEYQTLITGLLAIGAAGVAAWIAHGQLRTARDQIAVAREQIADQRALEERRRDSQLRAARASLPMALSAICDFSIAVVKQLEDAWPVSGVAAKLIVNEVKFPDHALVSLEKIVSLAESGLVVDQIELILRNAQIVSARLRRFYGNESSSKSTVASSMMRAVALHARAISLFPYSRGESFEAKPIWELYHLSAVLMSVDRDEVRVHAEKREERGAEPDALIDT